MDASINVEVTAVLPNGIAGSEEFKKGLEEAVGAAICTELDNEDTRHRIADRVNVFYASAGHTIGFRIRKFTITIQDGYLEGCGQ